MCPLGSSRLKYDLTNQEFDSLTALRLAPRQPGSVMWVCRCKCGNECLVKGTELRSGARKSCGCEHRKSHTTHGLSKLPEYNVWKQMKRRCTNQNTTQFKHYGGRGISFDPRWEKFENFYEDMGPRPSALHKLERKDNDDSYYKENCEWKTQEEQCNNTRRNIFIEHDGMRLTLSQWSRKTGLPIHTIRSRYRRKLSPEEIFSPTAGSIKTLEDEGAEQAQNYKNPIQRGVAKVPSKQALFLEHQGVTKHLEEWSIETGIDIRVLQKRIKEGVSEEEMFKPTNIMRREQAARTKATSPDPEMSGSSLPNRQAKGVGGRTWRTEE